MGFPGGSDGKESGYNAGDLGLIPGLGKSPGGGHGNLLHYSCLGNPMDREAWWVIQSMGLDMSKWLSISQREPKAQYWLPLVLTQGF